MFALDNAVVYDIETFPNCFTLAMECLHTEQKAVWEVSPKRDDRQYLIEWLTWLARSTTPMIGFNNIHFDYPVIHSFFHNPRATYDDLYAKAMQIIDGNDRFGNTVWADNRFAPQIDLFKIHHFDNRAKSTSLKWLEINMRSENVVDMPVEVGTALSADQVDHYLKPYNKHDVSETKKFAHYSSNAIGFRMGLIDQFGIDVLNWSDSKIGSETVIKEIGKELCYDYSSGRRKIRQTVRTSIPINDIIFPYVQFQNPEFQRVENYLRQQTLTKDEFDESIKTKGVFTNLKAHVGGMDYDFGVGGIHGSLERKAFVATEDWLIKDIDVVSKYPSIGIVNRLSPAHLGDAFCSVYAELPKRRKHWQEIKGKKCVEANSIKLGGNSVYGNSNNKYSPFYDPQYTMTVTINGQLMLCMLAEQLAEVPTLQMIQINTDGMTYVVHRDYLDLTKQIENWWEQLTALELEEQFYTRMWIRDVNSYISESYDGTLKQKGAYWHPDPDDYHGSISSSQPPAWHKNLSNVASVRAAVAHMTTGADIETWLRFNTDPYDFMCAVKAKGKDRLFYGGGVREYYHEGQLIDRKRYCEIWYCYRQQFEEKGGYLTIDGANGPDPSWAGLEVREIGGQIEVQRTSRYYVSVQGGELIKKAPPPKGKVIGNYCKANGITDLEYQRVMQEVNWAWDERVCTKNKSVYKERKTNVCAGYNVSLCNDANDFDWSNLNYDWYVAEARKLII